MTDASRVSVHLPGVAPLEWEALSLAPMPQLGRPITPPFGNCQLSTSFKHATTPLT